MTICNPVMDYPNVPSSLPDEGTFHICRFNADWLQYVIGAVEKLRAYCWEDQSDAIIDARGHLDLLLDMLMTDYVPVGGDLMIGEIKSFLHDPDDPRLLLLNGQLIAKLDYPDLFDAWNVTDSTMHLPNMSKRVLQGVFNSEDQYVGEYGGSNTVTIGEVNLPPHTHPGVPELTYALAYGHLGVGDFYAGTGPHPIHHNVAAHDTGENDGDNFPLNIENAWLSALFYVVALDS